MIEFKREKYQMHVKTCSLRERLVIKTDFDKSVLLAIRVDGLLLDVVFIETGRTYSYNLRYPMLPDDCHITVENILEDIDLTLPQNSHMRDFDYFKAKYQDRLSS